MLPAGEDGEVCARGGNFMQRYWNRPEETAEVFRDGWYRTGDEGHLDADGYVYLVDRVKDMIVSGGENVYSIEVEKAISTHPAVEQVAVIGIPHPTWGEQVHAIVVLRPGSRPPQRSCSSTPVRRSPTTRCPSPSSSAPNPSRCRVPQTAQAGAPPAVLGTHRRHRRENGRKRRAVSARDTTTIVPPARKRRSPL